MRMKNLLRLLFIAIFFFTVQHCFSQGFYNGFRWSSFQGRNFLTPSKDQKEMGPCHIFAAVAQVESLYELLYFKPGAELDLSEYQMYSSCTNKGAEGTVFGFLENYGVASECATCDDLKYPECCGDACGGISCLNQAVIDCDDPDTDYKYKIEWEAINIGGYSNDADIQRLIYEKGPIAMLSVDYDFMHQEYTSGGHSMLLQGWKIGGDGRLKWLFKDSWPEEDRLDYEIDALNLDLTTLFDNPANKAKIITKVDRYEKNSSGIWEKQNPARAWVDEDQDGYYFWGVGDKPAGCPSIHNEQDFDDDDPTEGPLSYTTGLPIDLPPPPYMTAPVAQMYIYGPPRYGGYCGSNHTLNSSYWKNITGDQIDWYPYYGSTPTSYTGPSYSAPGGVGLYLYLEATGGCYNQKGIVESKYYYHIPLGSTNYALKYYYHMYGSSMGSLKVKFQIYPSTSWVEYGSTKSGNKGNYWNNESISLSGLKGESIKIRFEGTTGWGQYSDMAIQNISIITSSGKSAGSIIEDPRADNDDQSHQAFRIFPNPATDNLFIQAPGSVEYNISIYNATGQLVYQEELNADHTIDVGSFTSGLYFVQITYNDPEPKVFVENVLID